MGREIIYPDMNFHSAGVLVLTWHKNELHCLLRLQQKSNFVLCWNFFGGMRINDEHAAETASRMFQAQSNFGLSGETVISLLSSNSYPLYIPLKNYYIFVLFVDMGDNFTNSDSVDLIPWGSICRDKSYQGIVLSKLALSILDDYSLHRIVHKFLNNNGFVHPPPLLVRDLTTI
jgi:hypothetical protein